MRSPYVAYLSPLDSFFAVASERFWSGSPFSDSLELFKYIPSASLNPEKLRSGEAGRASTPSGELLYPLRTGLSHTGVYGRFSLGSSGGGSSENRQMLLAGVAYLPHPQIPHQAIQIIRMHAEHQTSDDPSAASWRATANSSSVPELNEPVGVPQRFQKTKTIRSAFFRSALIRPCGRPFPGSVSSQPKASSWTPSGLPLVGWLPV